MAFAEEIAKSVNDPRVLLELDISQLNIQWVNIGAGIWESNALNLYAYVDASLFPAAYTAQAFGFVGSVQEDGTELTKVDTLAEVTTNATSFFYNSVTRSLYIRLSNYDEPWLHTVRIGIISYFSFDEFTPSGAVTPAGRLVSIPNVSIARDPLFYGKLSYGGGEATIANQDGELDSLGQDNSIYGNKARIKVGFAGIDISAYYQLFTGYIGNISIGEQHARVQLLDKRAQLTKPIAYTCTAQNALDTIKDILTTNFPITYTSAHFETTTWTALTSSVGNVTIGIPDTPKGKLPAIEVIEQICTSVFGLFLSNREGKYTFKLVNTSATASSTLQAIDFRGEHNISYDPTQVISSVKVGYARDYATTGDQYQYVTDPTRQSSVFNAYQTYNEQTFLTLLPDATAATAYASTILDYFDAVHGKDNWELPLSYYDRGIGDIVDAQIRRPQKTMIGTTKSEIVSIDYDLNKNSIYTTIRFV